MAFDREDPYWWYIEPGIAAICHLINDSGLGETEFSCEGHTRCERSEYSEGVDPYVLFSVLDRERAAMLIEPLLAITGDGYHCEVRWLDESWGTSMAIYLNVQNYHNFYKVAGHKKRRRSLERARAHLTEVLRQALAPNTVLVACPARRCIHHREEDIAGQEYRYSPDCSCTRPEMEGALVTYAATATCVQRCPHYRRKCAAGNE